jgi:hypothetical protein
MPSAPQPGSTLLVTLGASKFPRIKLKSSTAFDRAATSVYLYFASSIGFGLPVENCFLFFDSPYDPNTLDEQITILVRTRMQQLEFARTPAENLVVYYVGHGSFDEQKRYYLALQSTRQENQSVSSLRVETLMTTLNYVAGNIRKYVIIDACFAGEAVYSQSDVNTAVARQIRTLPQKGTAFLCSSSRELISEFLRDESNTVFTKALGESLWEGNSKLPSTISLEQLHTVIVEKLSASGQNFINPEIHTPDQPEGDIAKIPIFPNGPRRNANLLAEREQKAKEQQLLAYWQNQREEQARHAEKISADKRARDQEIRRQLLEEQQREEQLQAQALRHYDSEAERKFREEAEDRQNHHLNPDLLVAWFGWKVNESKVLAGALTEEAKTHQSEADKNRYYASNVWDNLQKEEKSGAPSSANMLREHWLELIKTAEREDKVALSLSDQAEDAVMTAEIYSNKMMDIGFVQRRAAEAHATERSFKVIIDSDASISIKRVHTRRGIRRFASALWKWTRRIVIVMLIFFLFGMFAMCSQYLDKLNK